MTPDANRRSELRSMILIEQVNVLVAGGYKKRMRGEDAAHSANNMCCERHHR